MKNFFFQHPKAAPFGFSKTVFAVQGGNFSKKKILRFWKSLKYVQECHVKCLWLKSKIAQLSPPPIIRLRCPTIIYLNILFFIFNIFFLNISTISQAHVSDTEDQDLWSGGWCGVQRGPGDQECRLQAIQIRLPEVGCLQWSL